MELPLSSHIFMNIPISSSTRRFILYLLFFFSGCSALIYQVIWQRMLFTLFGIDLDSVTIIISVFMFGLGVGSLSGGLIADKLLTKLLLLYILIEIAIAVFGFCSPFIINVLTHVTTNQSEIITGILSFCILAIPTILMGATLPILVSEVNKADHHIGNSVGNLYFVNTLGGALGAYFSGFILLYSMDLIGAIHRAVFLNIAIALTALFFFRSQE